MTLYKGAILTFVGLTEKDKENTAHHTFEVESYEDAPTTKDGPTRFLVHLKVVK